jgi:DNA polymerase IV (DinB-like DNA polymerase)
MFFSMGAFLSLSRKGGDDSLSRTRKKTIMLFDLDYFYAQVEEVKNPAIKDKPVLVCVYSGRTSDSGVVSTANYVARRYGVGSGMPIVLAKRKLEGVDSIFLPMDHDYYKSVSDRVMAILKGYADALEQVGIDEAYLDVTAKMGEDYSSAREYALLIKGEVFKHEGLTASIGIGPNKLIAKIAADVNKPDGITVVRPEEVVAFLSPLPVDRLMGVGKKTSGILEAMGVKTIGDLAGVEVKRLCEEFGDSLGKFLHNASMGFDEEVVHERGDADSISRIATLKEDTRDLGVITLVTDALCSEVHDRLRQRSLSFRTVGVVAIMRDMSIQTRSKTLGEPTDDLTVLCRTTRDLMEKLIKESNRYVRRAGVKVSGLVAEKRIQRSLTSFFQ